MRFAFISAVALAACATLATARNELNYIGDYTFQTEEFGDGGESPSRVVAGLLLVSMGDGPGRYDVLLIAHDYTYFSATPMATMNSGSQMCRGGHDRNGRLIISDCRLVQTTRLGDTAAQNYSVDRLVLTRRGAGLVGTMNERQSVQATPVA